MTFSGHFFAICMFIFHKTEVQTVILRSLTGLKSEWVQNLWQKNANISISIFLQFCIKTHLRVFFRFFVLSHNFCTNSRFRLIKQLKMTVWISVLWKINMQLAKNGQIWSKNRYLSVVIFWEFTELAWGLRLHLRP